MPDASALNLSGFAISLLLVSPPNWPRAVALLLQITTEALRVLLCWYHSLPTSFTEDLRGKR
jgi:hypothetical protein